ncbi:MULTISPECIES: hypothetical protein [Burkholderia]|uniref:hypothetical protein n=1 Tax=Burkholderia TaxID=32008 RepID=UPI000C013C4D|nr:hypothetical protein [Burkholderia sp. JKS000303]PFH12891.1 hypothetical protein BX604_7311 [Burkholderia sp. JKS000303]
MRLAEYMVKATAKQWLHPPELPFIRQFGFGEMFRIGLVGADGSVIVDDFETMLGIIRSEFDAYPEYLPHMEIRGWNSSPLVVAVKNLWLIVTAVQYTDELTRPPFDMDEFLQKIRVAVATYNLRGTWYQFNQENL